MWNFSLPTILLLALGAYAQSPSGARAKIARFTEKNPYSRFADGRPRVPDEVLDRIR